MVLGKRLKGAFKAVMVAVKQLSNEELEQFQKSGGCLFRRCFPLFRKTFILFVRAQLSIPVTFPDRCLASQRAIVASGCWDPAIIRLLSLQLRTLSLSAVAFPKVVHQPSVLSTPPPACPGHTQYPALHTAPHFTCTNPCWPAECQGHRGRKHGMLIVCLSHREHCRGRP